MVYFSISLRMEFHLVKSILLNEEKKTQILGLAGLMKEQFLRFRFAQP
jgi:hypothetical protein